MPTPTLKPPLPIAATGTTTINREILGDEYVTALADIATRMSVYTRMRRSDGAVNTSLMAVEKPILGASWEVAGDDEIAEAVRDELFTSPHVDQWEKPLIEQALAHLITYMQYGFAACEPFWQFVEDDGRIHCTRLTLIRPESVRTFRIDRASGRLESLVQWCEDRDGMMRDITVPVEQLLFICHGREGSDYSGVALIRSSYRAWMERDVIRKTRLWHHDRFGAGTPVATYPQDAGDDMKSDIDNALANFRSGARSYLAFPHGTEFTLHGGAVSGLDPTPELAALASEIAKNTLTQVTELGTQGNTGNRALGGTFTEVLTRALQGYAEDLAAILRRGLVQPFVRWNFGDTAEAPELRVRVSLAGVAEMLDNLTKAKGAGLSLEPEDMLIIRDELELPEIELDDLTARQEARRQQAIEEAKAKSAFMPQLADPTPTPAPAPLPAPALEQRRRELLAEIDALPAPTSPPDMALDWLGRYRAKHLVDLEEAVLRPKMLSDALDTETARAAGEVMEVLREIDVALVAQARDLAEQGGEALTASIDDIAVPPKLAKRLRSAIEKAAERAQEIGAQAVRDEMRRQGLDVAPIGTPAQRSLGERLLAVFGLADSTLFGGLKAYLRAILAIAVTRETSQREQAAQQGALEEIARQATTGAISAEALAQSVKDRLGERSVRSVQDRVAQVVNVAFGQGRAEEASRFDRFIERQIRSEALDAFTCEHCAEHDGDDFPFNDPRAPELPDPQCDGSYRCRGVWIYELASETTP